MEAQTARKAKWGAVILGTLLLMMVLYSAQWGGLLTFIHVLACALLVTAILIQSGKGGGLAALGGMGDQSPFGTHSSAALRHVSYFLAGVFLTGCLFLVRLPKVMQMRARSVAPAAVDRTQQPGTGGPALPNPEQRPDAKNPAAPTQPKETP